MTMDAISPELVLVDPALGRAEHSVGRPIDGYAASGIETVAPRFAPHPPQRAHARERPSLVTALLLLSLLANGFLTSFVLFGRQAERQPAVTPTATPGLQPQPGTANAGALTPAPPVPPNLRRAAVRRVASTSAPNGARRSGLHTGR
jgi:hypothetical protein